MESLFRNMKTVEYDFLLYFYSLHLTMFQIVLPYTVLY